MLFSEASQEAQKRVYFASRSHTVERHQKVWRKKYEEVFHTYASVFAFLATLFLERFEETCVSKQWQRLLRFVSDSRRYASFRAHNKHSHFLPP